MSLVAFACALTLVSVPDLKQPQHGLLWSGNETTLAQAHLMKQDSLPTNVTVQLLYYNTHNLSHEDPRGSHDSHMTLTL